MAEKYKQVRSKSDKKKNPSRDEFLTRIISSWHPNKSINPDKYVSSDFGAEILIVNERYLLTMKGIFIYSFHNLPAAKLTADIILNDLIIQSCQKLQDL